METKMEQGQPIIFQKCRLDIFAKKIRWTRKEIPAFWFEAVSRKLPYATFFAIFDFIFTAP
jgi:hypothetical protein